MIKDQVKEISGFFKNIEKTSVAQNITQPSMKLLSGDASSRIYWRFSDNGQTSIVCLYPEAAMQESLKKFIYWQKKYQAAGILVPAILHVDYEKQIVIQEDVGDEFLQKTLGDASADTEYKILSEAIEVLHKVRAIDTSDYAAALPSFNETKLMFEVNHTQQHFIAGYLGEKDQKKVNQLLNAWKPIVTRLEKLPMTLCHRDYHSRNIMYFKNHVYIIDFQDSMLGSVHYDLCSLMDDCYLRYHPSTYQKIMRNYFDVIQQDKKLQSSYEDFFVHYQLMKLQRQYKAIGSFASVWMVKNNPRFLKYISYVVESMKTSFEAIDLPEVKNLKTIFLGTYYDY